MIVELLWFILQCIYFFMPGYFANMSPVIVQKVPFLVFRLDFGLSFNNKPLFGKNKTFRGLFFGVVFGIGIAYVQYLLSSFSFFSSLSMVDYSQWLLIGSLMGLGAIVGDMVESFIKRQLNMKPGKPFFPFDQTDFVVGGLLFSMIAVSISWKVFVTLLLISVVLHILVNHIAYYTGIRNEKW